MLITTGAKVLTEAHASTVARVLALSPVASCLVAAKFEQVGMDTVSLGGRFWGVAGGREGLCFDGANLMPLSGDLNAVNMFAAAAGKRGRRCGSILGPAELVLPMWERLAPRWGPAREIRPVQPLLAMLEPVAGARDDGVQVVTPSQLDAYFPAAVAMFTEEVGVDPRWPDDGVGYRKRVAGLIGARRSFARFIDGRVAVKAEIGAMSSRVALIQGVWVAPEHRGQGLAAPFVAEVCRLIGSTGRIPSLYVNAHNLRARKAYSRVGFTQVGTFASVLF